jgi:hypothetical protein
MVSFNELLKKREQYPRGSDKWRELDRASLFVQGVNNIKNVTRQLDKMPQWKVKSPFQREDYARDRVARGFESLAKTQKETWRKRDIMQIRDDLRTSHGD